MCQQTPSAIYMYVATKSRTTCRGEVRLYATCAYIINLTESLPSERITVIQQIFKSPRTSSHYLSVKFKKRRIKQNTQKYIENEQLW